jgi:hypothetical protein
MPNDSMSYSRPFCSVITVPDPDRMPVAGHVEQGGTLQFRTDTHRYPTCEIRFIGDNPFDETTNKVLPGSDIKPIVGRLEKNGNYQYTVRHFKDDGTSVDSGTFAFNVNPCRGCPQTMDPGMG